MNNITLSLARLASIIFHPLLIPTIGFLLLFNSGFYFAIMPLKIQLFILIVVFVSTCVLPLISILLLGLNPQFSISMDKNTDRVMPLMLSSVFYYTGYLIFKRLPIFPIYNLFLISSIIVQILLLVISMKWKISAHLAAIGGLIGGFLGLSFRLQENPTSILIFLILIAGILGTARLALNKHTRAQIYAGFLLGMVVMLLALGFI
jgi:hypothetical protein